MTVHKTSNGASARTSSDARDLSIAVCIASFNRRETTRACLKNLFEQQLAEGWQLQIYLLDDASTDGTAAMVRSQFPSVRVFDSRGELWWAGGMRVAFGAALADGHDFYIWMNDDVVAKPDALKRLIDTYRKLQAEHGGAHLISGAMQDPETLAPSYGGFRLKNPRFPKPFTMVIPDPEKPLPCDLTNANMLLIPAEIADRLGNISDVFVHTLGDWDYGLRARKAQARLWVAPGYVGYCKFNEVGDRRLWDGAGLTLRQRYAKMQHPLALPFRSRAAFLVRHFPWTAPIFIPGPYLKLPFDHLRWSRQTIDD